MRHSLTAFLRLAPLCTVLFLLGQLQTARADVTWTGDVDPADPTAWTSSTNGYVGKTADGTLDITGGGAVNNSSGSIGGYRSGSTGVVTVDGAGSTWTNGGGLFVGNSGSGTLSITNSGAVSVVGDTRVSRSSGAIYLNNGTLTTDGFFGAPNALSGTGTINARGLVTDVDLVFDDTHGSSQTFYINDHPDQNITLNLDIDGTSSMGAGFGGVGTMSISDGIAIASLYGYIGYQFGSTGAVTVDGAGSTWTNSSSLLVGRSGSGTLNITNGGAVSNSWGAIGYGSGLTGVVTVDGAGSAWTNSGTLYVGNSGSGTLNITGGGAVTVADDTWIDRYSRSEGGTLLLGIGPDGTGLLDIGGDLTIGETSTLLMTFDGGAIPTVGDDFTLITFDGSLFGTFTNEPTPTLAGDYLLSWAVNYNANDITLEVVSSFLAADFDHDGDVDGADYLVWQSSFGSTTNLAADGNGSGVIDAADYTVWRDAFGSGASSQVSQAAVPQTTVPEPSTLFLLLASVATVLNVKRNAP